VDDVIKQFKNEIIEAPVSRTVEHIIQEQVHGYFYFNDLYRIVQNCTDGVTEGAVRQTLKRLAKDGVVEKTKKWGEYRKVEDDCMPMDFVNAPTEEMDVRLPLGISELISIYPKNILLIAGVFDAGKSCFMLNTVKLNMDTHDVYYFNSEMGASELRLRLSKFEDIGLEDWRFFPFERSANFSDVVRPDDINIIDYLEVEDNFFLIAKELKMIHEKLDKGIALIALQKDPYKEFGRGGSFGLEKPRLYMTLDRGGVAKIIKAKNWRGASNPNGKICNFKIVNGSQLTGDEWHRPDDEATAGYEMYRRKQ